MAVHSVWRNLKHLAGLLVIALTLSCIIGGGSDSPPPQGSLQIFNDGNATMVQLFVTPSTSSTWGPEQLSPDVLFPGESLTFAPLFPDSYDVLAEFSDGSSDQVFDVLVQDGLNTTLGMLNSGNGAVAVFNNSGLTINGVYLTPSSATTFGPNQTDQPLFSGQTLTLTGIAPGSYDLRVIFANGGFADQLGIGVSPGIITNVQVN